MSGIDIAFADDDFFSRVKFNVKNFEAHSTNLLITGDAKQNKVTLFKLTALCNELIKRNNYDSGVTITLTDEANYQDFINLMDIGFKTNVTFAPFKNKVYFLVPKPIKEAKTPYFICGNVSHVDAQSKYLPIEQFFNINAVRLWPSSIAFVLMMFFSIRDNRYITAHR
ncbi:hypothetical protein [Mucilaginibacter psychrotolerans]|nr:hypothetical protein [Mucilaginibacter psychrotolerans]